jgi:hypothetical protein
MGCRHYYWNKGPNRSAGYGGFTLTPRDQIPDNPELARDKWLVIKAREKILAQCRAISIKEKEGKNSGLFNRNNQNTRGFYGYIKSIYYATVIKQVRLSHRQRVSLMKVLKLEELPPLREAKPHEIKPWDHPLKPPMKKSED